MNELLVILSLLLFIIIGYSIITSFQLINNLNILEKLPYSFGVGVGLISFQLFAYSQLHIGWSLFSIISPWIFLVIFTFLRFRRVIRDDFIIDYRQNEEEEVHPADAVPLMRRWSTAD